MEILVTGATGFVGGAIVEELAAANNAWKIHCFGSRESKNFSKLQNFYKVDITNYKNLSVLKAPVKLDAVIHSAGLAHQFERTERGEFFKVNVEGTRNILRFAESRLVEHFVLISSVAVYGSDLKNGQEKSFQKFDENVLCRPQGEYAESKLQAEEEAVKFCREKDISLTILRLATVIGEGDRGNVARLIEAIDKDRFLMIGKGENYKTLIYKKDAARACRMILEKRKLSEKGFEILNVAAEPVRMKYIVEKITENLTKKPLKIFIPFSFVFALLRIFAAVFHSEKIQFWQETLKKWAADEIFSNELLRRKYSFVPETSISEAIKREVSFYKKQKC